MKSTTGYEKVTVTGASEYRVYVKSEDGKQGYITLNEISHEFVPDASRHETIRQAVKKYEEYAKKPNEGNLVNAKIEVKNITHPDKGSDDNFYSLKATINDPYEEIKKLLDKAPFICEARKKTYQPQPDLRAYVELKHEDFDEPKQTWLDLKKEVSSGRIKKGTDANNLEDEFEVTVVGVGKNDKQRRVFIIKSDETEKEEETEDKGDEDADAVELEQILRNMDTKLDRDELNEISDCQIVRYYLKKALEEVNPLLGGDPDLKDLDSKNLIVILKNIPSVVEKNDVFGNETDKKVPQHARDELFLSAVKWLLYILHQHCRISKKDTPLDKITKEGFKRFQGIIKQMDKDKLKNANSKDNSKPIIDIIKLIVNSNQIEEQEPECPIWDEIIGNKDVEFWSKKIKKLREDLGLQQAEMATVLGTTPSSYQAWEDVTGRKLPDHVRENQIYFLSRLSDNEEGQKKLSEICKTENGRYYLASLLICFKTEKKPLHKDKTLFGVISENKPSKIANKTWMEAQRL